MLMCDHLFADTHKDKKELSTMEKRILAIMVTLVVVAALVVGVVMIAAGGGIRLGGGGFTDLFDDLEYTGNYTTDQQLSIPSDWNGDTKAVKDVIVDITYREQTVSQTKTIFYTTLYFAYLGDKWNNPLLGGQSFEVPTNYLDHGDYWMEVEHGLFSVTVETVTNLTEDYSIGDSITLETKVALNGNAILSFSLWSVKGVV
jgi:hypothetical protein